MKRPVLIRVLSGLAVVLTLCVGISGPPAQAEPSRYRFDFGAGPAADGYTAVSAGDAYDRHTHYGFHTPEGIADVPASGTGPGTDAVRFLTSGMKSTNTFDVDLPDGLYNVRVMLGDTARSSVAAEGVYQIIDMTGNEATDSFEVPVTDGQLNLLITPGKVGYAFTLAALEITKASRHPVTHRTVYIGGDSTVCNYYPRAVSYQAGWGQLLPNFVDPDTFRVKNLASGGQFARGFKNDGQLESILKYIKPGDYFILQLGINDTAEKNRTTEAQFTRVMRSMVAQVKATGATVVLSTAQGRATDFDAQGVHSAVDRWYRHAVVALAQEEQVTLVDLNVLSSAYFTSIGPGATADLYMPDGLHPNRIGATVLAWLVAGDLRRQGLAGFSDDKSVNARAS